MIRLGESLERPAVNSQPTVSGLWPKIPISNPGNGFLIASYSNSSWSSNAYFDNVMLLDW
jgi:hypothetical protein